MEETNLEEENPLKKDWKYWLNKALGWGIILLGVFLIGILTFYLCVVLGFFGSIPSRKDLKEIQSSSASEIYSSDGVLLGKYFIQERTNVKYSEISPFVINALVATEDSRFYKHEGVDWRSLMRVALKTLLLSDESSGGGSTISQQLAKNLYTRKRHGWLTLPVNKVREMVIARRLEKNFSKEEILTLYLNTVPFGGNAFGIATASQRYFSKDPNQLFAEEAAVLVGLLKANTTYNPLKYPAKAVIRRNVVLGQMNRYGYLTNSELTLLKEKPLKLKYSYKTHNEGLAPYFREHIRQELNDWCKNHKKPDGSAYNLYTDGLKIYTTIHSGLQIYAEEAVREHMKELQNTFYKHWGNKRPWNKDKRILTDAIHKTKRYKQLSSAGLSEIEIREQFNVKRKMKVFTWNGDKEFNFSPLDSVKYYLGFLQAGFMALDPQTGNVLAWVGGIDHKYFKFDHVNINTKRQVGSVFKPIVYAAALEKGIKPCDYIPNEKLVFEAYENWSPGNADNKYGGYYSMQGGLVNSVNTISVNLLMETGFSKVARLARNMGISSNIPEVPSIALGTPNISLFEMVAAYATFPNRGHAVNPVYFSKIMDHNGTVLETFNKQHASKEVMSKRSADMVVHMLKNVVNKGTAGSLRGKYALTREMAGKTGTTQSYADGWFIGFTPNLVAGVWVGSDDPSIHFRNLQLGQASSTALPIWAKFMSKVFADKELNLKPEKFTPLNAADIEAVDCEMFIEEKPKGIEKFFDKLFGKDDRQKNRSKRKKAKKRKGLFDRIKDVF